MYTWFPFSEGKSKGRPKKAASESQEDDDEIEDVKQKETPAKTPKGMLLNFD